MTPEELDEAILQATGAASRALRAARAADQAAEQKQAAATKEYEYCMVTLPKELDATRNAAYGKLNAEREAAAQAAEAARQAHQAHYVAEGELSRLKGLQAQTGALEWAPQR